MFKSRLVNESAANTSLIKSEWVVDACASMGPEALTRSVKVRAPLAAGGW